ncbi:hypothetical protein J7E95_35555 [Streptomyces sp. ISL-14]|nr:hypothetical protein [Streptomyces sp. ISL-14]
MCRRLPPALAHGLRPPPLIRRGPHLILAVRPPSFFRAAILAAVVTWQS